MQGEGYSLGLLENQNQTHLFLALLILIMKGSPSMRCSVNPKYNINRFDLQGSGDFTWMVSDCEELVGLLTGDDGVGFSGSFLYYPFYPRVY